MTHQKFLPTDMPDHPQAQLMSEQMQLLDLLLDAWVWVLDDRGFLGVTLRLKGDGATMALAVRDDGITVDVYAGNVPFDAHMLTWVLMENLGQRFIARAEAPKNGLVPIYVVGTYAADALPQLAQLVWDGFEAALTWRGRMWQVELPDEPETISA